MYSRARVSVLDDDEAFLRLESDREFVQGFFVADSEVFGTAGAAFGSGSTGFEIVEHSDEHARLSFRGGASASAAVGNDGRVSTRAAGSGRFVLEFELLEAAEISVNGSLEALSNDEHGLGSGVVAMLDGVFDETLDSGEEEWRRFFTSSAELDAGVYQLTIESWAETLANNAGDNPRAAYGDAAYEISIDLHAINPSPSSLSVLVLAGLSATRRRR